MSGGGATLDSDRFLTVDLEPLFQKLKPGPGLSAEEVFADQRRRLHAALIALTDSSDWSRLRVRSLAQKAGVSTATFYKHFANADECFASTYDTVMATTMRRLSTAQRRGPDWHGSLRETVKNLLDALAAEPRAARFALVEIFGAGPGPRRRISHAVEKLERLLAASFVDAPLEVTPPRHLVAGMTAGILRVARTTMLAGRADELPGIAEELCKWMESLPSPELLSLLTVSDSAAATRRRERLPLPVDQGSIQSTGTDARRRLLNSALKLTAAGGLTKVTPPELRAEAEVPRRLFDTTFGSLEECLLEAIEMVVTDASSTAKEWSASADAWERRTCRFTLALCTQAARNRSQARLAFIGIFATGRTGLLRREHLVSRMASELQGTVPDASRPGAIAAEASIAAAWHIVQSDIAAGRARGLPLVAPLLSYVVLAPIVGPRMASAAILDEFAAENKSRPDPSYPRSSIN